MESKVYNTKGKEVGKVKLPETVFGVKWNGDLVHQVITSALSSRRENTAHTKGRGEVAGGGKKPWRQKGTGRARHGSIRSPLWVGGGVTHGPIKDKNYDRKINKKMRTKALYAILSKKLQDGEVIFVDKISLAKPKTSEAREILEGLSKVKDLGGILQKKNNSSLISLAKNDPNTVKSFRNFSNVATTVVNNLNPVQILNYKYLVFVEPESTVAVLSSKLKASSSKQ